MCEIAQQFQGDVTLPANDHYKNNARILVGMQKILATRFFYMHSSLISIFSKNVLNLSPKVTYVYCIFTKQVTDISATYCRLMYCIVCIQLIVHIQLLVIYQLLAYLVNFVLAIAYLFLYLCFLSHYEQYSRPLYVKYFTQFWYIIFPQNIIGYS